MAGLLAFFGLWALSELATVIYSQEILQTQGSQQQIDCLVRQEKIPDEYIIKISDKWTEKQPNLAFNQKGQINSRQLWLCFEGQMGYSISFEAPSWWIWFFKNKPKNYIKVIKMIYKIITFLKPCTKNTMY